MKIEYVVSVKRVIDTAARGETPKPEEKVLVDFTGGPDEASAVLAALAERVKSGKKLVGWTTFVEALAEQVDKHNAKAKAEGKPTLGEAVRGLFADSPTKR